MFDTHSRMFVLRFHGTYIVGRTGVDSYWLYSQSEDNSHGFIYSTCVGHQ